MFSSTFYLFQFIFADTTHDGSVNGVAFTPDGLHLATIGTDQKLTLWNTWSGKKFTTRYPPLSHIKKRSVKFALVEGGQESTVFVPTGTCLTHFPLKYGAKGKKLYGHYNNVNCCVFDETRHLLLTGGNDHKILVWSYKGDRDYQQFLLHRRDRVISPKDRANDDMEGEKHFNVTDNNADAIRESETMPQTFDTWSDDDDNVDYRS